MKTSISAKFIGIAYPIFVLKTKPYKLMYTLDKITCMATASSHTQTIDDKSLQGDYFGRLLSIKERVSFDYTCKNLQELIFCKGRWGIDKNAGIHDLSRNMSVPTESRKVVRIEKNLVWLYKISYPFRLHTNENIFVNDDLYAILVLVNNEWFLKEFSYDRNHNTRKLSIV
jgi:hypothetical protein